MKKIKCKYINCNNKIQEGFSDMWKCKCEKYYCPTHKFSHDCIKIIEKSINDNIVCIPIKVDKI